MGHTLERVNHKTTAKDRAAVPRGWGREAEQRMPGKKKGAEVGAEPCHDDGVGTSLNDRYYMQISLAVYVFLKNERKVSICYPAQIIDLCLALNCY